LERAEGVPQFTRYTTYATLTIPPVGDAARALTLLEKAEHGCLVANSLKGERHLEVQIVYWNG
jgi:organic hydroperoxide reductase OsmC/OhrA